MTEPPASEPDPSSTSPAPRASLLGAFDRLLRGEYTDADALRAGNLAIPIRTLALGSVLLGAVYGASMGLFSGLNAASGNGSWVQVVASAVKVPVLFLLTLLVTFPSLYVVSALSRSRLQTADTMRVLLGAVAVNLALLASLGPVAAFFTLSTDSYPFMKLLHVLFFAVSGFAGLGFLWRALQTILEPPVDSKRSPALITVEQSTSAEDPSSSPGTTPEGLIQRSDSKLPLDVDHSRRIRRVFQLWILIFGLVGAQMGWILRPFIGAPSRDFTWFRERGSNVLQDILRTLGDLF